MSIYEELSQKAINNERITSSDLRRLAMVDSIVNKCMTIHDLNGWPLEDTLTVCVCILAAQLNSTQEALSEHYAHVQPTITIVDTDGEVLAQLKKKENEA